MVNGFDEIQVWDSAEPGLFPGRLEIPGTTDDLWQGGLRRKFTFEGREAWVVEPRNPGSKNRWFWVPEWPDSYADRNGVKELLGLGYTMAYVNILGTGASPDAVEVMHRFREYLRERGLTEKAAFIGMSMGGLYSFRYTAKYPEDAACIYADAPACDLGYRLAPGKRDALEFSRAYGYGDDVEKLRDNPLSPVNNLLPIAKARIPVLMLLGLDDQVLPPDKNGRLFAQRFTEAGGKIRVISRYSWGHHPHGLTDPLPLVQFILEHSW